MGDIGSKLFDAVERENKADIEKILNLKPELMDAAFNPKSTLTPLLRLVWRGNFDLVQWLLDRGANVNVQVNEGHTALIWAAIRSRLKILQLLLSRGADIYLCDKYGFTALDHAVVQGNYEEALLLRRAVRIG